MMTATCGACGGGLRPWHDAVVDPVGGGRYSIVACSSCRLGWTRPRPADLRSAYAGTYYGGRHGVTARLRAAWRLRRVASTAGPANGRRLLDVGCGEGTFLAAARDAGWRVAGSELHAEPARGAGLDVRNSLDEFADLAPFACLTLWHSLEHMADPLETLTRARRLLDRDGVLLAAVPNARGLQASLFGPDWLHLDVPRHLVHFDPESLVHLLDRSGFLVIRRWHEEFEYDVMGWSQSLLNALLPTRNGWLDALMGRPPRCGPFETLASWILGPAASAAGVPLAAIGALLRCGGTFVVAARRT
jgi:SAM-dependent methyltransferase